MAKKKTTTKKTPKINFHDWAVTNASPKKIKINGFVALTLNTYNIRGYTSMQNLVRISAADVYEEGKNDKGVQRPDKPTHAKKTIDYALGLNEKYDTASKFYWGDILLCNRTTNATSFNINGKKYEELTQDELSQYLGEEVEIIIDTSKLDLDSIKYEKEPDISRVDGNHRLKGYQYKFEDRLKDKEPTNDLEELQTPFTMLPGLTVDEEDYIFEMVNGTPMKVDTSQVKAKRARRMGVGLLEGELNDLCLAIATELKEDGNAFKDLVYSGGRVDTQKKKLGRTPPLKLAPLSNYVKQQLKVSSTFVDANINEPMNIIKTVVAYWNSVKDVFPELFLDQAGKKGEFIMFQAVGMYGFGMLGGKFMNDFLNEDNPNKDYFKKRLKILQKNVDMSRTNPEFSDAAGFGGGKKIYMYFLSEVSDLEIKKSQISEIF